MLRQYHLIFSSLIFTVFILSACKQDAYYLFKDDQGLVVNDGNPNDGDPVQYDIFDLDIITDTQIGDLPIDMSMDACLAMSEVCNNADDNCNDEIDEGFDKLGDPRYCENCKGCSWLYAENAVPGCQAGSCVIASCSGGYVDLDNDVKNGCEYLCTATGPELCDGVDNNCDGQIDEGVVASQNTCIQYGACSGSQPICRGTLGWVCNYGSDVELLPCTKDDDCGSGIICDKTLNVCPGVVTTNETRCDGIDNDCDNVADDPWTANSLANAIGKECTPDETQNGVCRAIGVYACNSAKDGVECQVTQPAQSPSDEICDGLDNDCDGKVDESEDDAAGKGVDDQMIHINYQANNKTYNFWIYRYEASKPDASLTGVGEIDDKRSCSKANVIPWNNVTYDQATLACQAAGKRLCTAEEWLVACQGSSQTLYPYGSTYSAQTCNGVDRGEGQSVVTGSLTNCKDSSGLFDMSGNLREWTSTSKGTANGKDVYDVRGGAYNTASLGLSCTFDSAGSVEDVVLPANGFRCCADQAD